MIALAVGLMVAQMGMQLAGSVMQGQMMKNRTEIEKQQNELAKLDAMKQTSKAIRNQYKGFESFMEAQERIISSQNAYLNSMNYDQRSSAYTYTLNNQQGKFYKNKSQLDENIKALKDREKMSILGIQTRNKIADYNLKAFKTSNMINTASQLFGTASDIAMMYKGSGGSGDNDTTIKDGTTPTNTGFPIQNSGSILNLYT